ncbi:hypothetical protein L596_000711 [Steinernema carpocapsae]|uniref:Uncharacterized protein n=1 Tax=Steinernema carpocapsae TaxID=34508 RepID=A0A4U8UN46_STECR|nr:hypothetical protein L596_000711 [Steinernema carpocapsae]
MILSSARILPSASAGTSSLRISIPTRFRLTRRTSGQLVGLRKSPRRFPLKFGDMEAMDTTLRFRIRWMYNRRPKNRR